jgi:hypothetical protein
MIVQSVRLTGLASLLLLGLSATTVDADETLKGIRLDQGEGQMATARRGPLHRGRQPGAEYQQGSGEQPVLPEHRRRHQELRHAAARQDETQGWRSADD